MSAPRYPARKKRPDGTYGCRGCGGDIPSRRQTWCSDACWEKHNPQLVIGAVRRRDKGLCQMCGCDCAAEFMRVCCGVEEARRFVWKIENMACWDVDWDRGRWVLRKPTEIDVKARRRELEAAWLPKEQWASSTSRGYEIDHIIPHSEGGSMTEENLRTLCIPCHRKVTAEFAARRALEKQRKTQPELILP